VALQNSIYSNGTLTPYPKGILTGSGFSASFTGVAINASGQVVGRLGGFHAGFYNNGTVTDLGVLPGADPSLDASAVLGINTSGQIVGWGANQSGEPVDAFIYSNSAMVSIGTFPGTVPFGVVSQANGINDTGQITGAALKDNGLASSSYDAFIYDNGTWIDIGLGEGFAINAAGQVTGVLSSVPDSTQNLPIVMVGRAFIYSSGSVTDLGTLPGGTTSVGYAINGAGQIVGASAVAGNSGTHAFFYNGAMQDMNALVSTTDPLQPFVTLTDARGINDSRLIVVNGIDSRTQLQHAYLLQGPWLDVAPGPLSFPSQAIGTVSAAQTAKLTNSGPTPLALGAVSTSGDFGQTNNCGASLAPGGACAVMVTFEPTTAGALSGALTILSAGVPIAVPLAGTGHIQVTISSSAATTMTDVPVTLTWAASPGASCTATGGSVADKWTGTIAGSGTQSVTEPTAATYHYGLTCKVGSQSASAATTVTDNAPPPAQSAGGGGGALNPWAVLFLSGVAAMRRLRNSSLSDTSRSKVSRFYAPDGCFEVTSSVP
jgi:probable HAF family extracellular repeat protein